MIGYKPLPLIKYCLKYVTPLICLVSKIPISRGKAGVQHSLRVGVQVGGGQLSQLSLILIFTHFNAAKNAISPVFSPLFVTRTVLFNVNLIL